MKSNHLHTMALLGGLALSAAAWAAEPAEAPATRVTHYSASYIVNPDGSNVESRRWSMAVLKPEAVATAGRPACP